MDLVSAVASFNLTHMVIITHKTVEELRASQRCRYIKGFMVCNFTIRDQKNGSIVVPNPGSGIDNIKFPVKWRPKKKEDDTLETS